jgi:hypothetical protein
MPTLVALVALLAFAPQAGATLEDSDEPVEGCVAGYIECPVDEPKAEEPKADEPKPEHTGSCGDEPVAEDANGSEEGGAKFEEGCLPQFVRRFVTRVWKFVGEVDYYEAGELSITLGKILNLPRRWRAQDDDLLDQDTTVLVSNRVRVFKEGERVARDELDTANDVRVHGKLLRPLMWHADEDGSPVPTIRAKKVYITG